MSQEMLVSSWVRVVVSLITEDFLLAAGQRLYGPAHVSTRERVKLVLSGFTMAFGCLHKAGCSCRVTRIYSAATSDLPGQTGHSTQVCFCSSLLWAAVIPNKKNPN